MSRYRLGRWAAGLAVLTSTFAASGLAVASASPTASPDEYTWTGQGSPGDPTGSNWSNSVNWTGGLNPAPTTSESIDALKFPDLGSCDSNTATCYYANDDMDGLSVNSLQFAPSTSYLVGGYNQDGTVNSLTLGGGGISVADQSTPQFSLPLVLGATQDWTLGANASLGLNNGVTGSGDLTVAFNPGTTSTSPSYVNLFGTNEVGNVTLSGPAPAPGSGNPAWANAENNGYVNLLDAGAVPGSQPADLNGTDGNQVIAQNVALTGDGSLGALTTTGSVVQVGNNANTPGILNVGSAKFDSGSLLTFDIAGTGSTAGTDYSQLLATPGTNVADDGSVDLGGAQVSVSTTYNDQVNNTGTPCVTPALGTTYTLVQAAAGKLSGTFSDFGGNPLPDGGVVMTAGCVPSGSTSPTPTYGFEIHYNDAAGTVTATAVDPTSTTLSSDPNPSTPGQSVVYTATVEDMQQSSSPSGTVTIKTGSTILCNAIPLTAGQPDPNNNNNDSATASCSSSTAPFGADPVVATYTPANGSTFGPSDDSAEGYEQWVQAPTTTSLGASTTSAQTGSSLSFTATVQAASGYNAPNPTDGTVAFYDAADPNNPNPGTDPQINCTNSTGYGAVDVGSNSQAVCQYTFTTTSSSPHHVYAQYWGDQSGDYDFSTSNVVDVSVSQGQTPPPATTTPHLAASTTTPAYRSPVTFTATLTPDPQSGTVSFYEAADPTSPAPATDNPLACTGAHDGQVSSAQATCTVAFTDTGTTHHVYAVFDDNANTTGTGPSNVVDVSVIKANPAVSLQASDERPTVNSAVTYTATVPADATGTVTFEEGTNPVTCDDQATAESVSSGHATCTVTYTSVLNHTVTASYSGDDNYNQAASGNVTVEVQPYATTTSLQADPASPGVGQADQLTATVAPQGSAPAGTPLQGTVDFGVVQGNRFAPLSGCTGVALPASAPYSVHCPATFNQSGSTYVEAEFTPARGSDFGASTGGGSLSVQALPGATSSSSGSSTDPSVPAEASDGNVQAQATGGQGTVVVSKYASDPAGAPSFNANGTYFDVQLQPGASFTSLTFQAPMPAGGSLYWYDPTSSKWLPVVGKPGPTPVAGNPSLASVTITPAAPAADASSPNLSQMTGTVFAVAAPVTPVTPDGYRMVASDGGIFAFNRAFYGSTGGTKLDQPIVGMANAKSGNGYYLVARDGGVFAFGPGTHFQGSTGGTKLNAPIVGMAVDPATGGYWLVASDGGIFAFNAPFYGSTGATKLNQPIVGISAAPDGKGYYLVARDGGIFAFGSSAHFQGSTGGVKLTQPIVGMAVDAATGGYWLVASDGGIFAFHAPFVGSTGGHKLNQPVVGITPDPNTGGYWLVAADGGIFNFKAPFMGSTGNIRLDQPIVGMS